MFAAAQAGCTWDAVVRDCDIDSVAIDPATFSAVADTGNGGTVSLTGYSPVSPTAARLWRSTLDYARHLAAQPDLSPLVTGHTARLLAATALATFPHNAALEPTIADRRDAHPRTLHRAIAYIETHPDLDLSVTDIARAASTSARALQLAFRRHLDTTPMAYLRRTRLDRAHADLQAANPDDTTVAAIAHRWGFANHGRFAAYHAAIYGQPPSATLGAPPTPTPFTRSAS